MNSVVVDTNVFSYIYRGDSRAAQYQKHIDGSIACLSFMTVAELYRWGMARKWGASRFRQLHERIQEFQTLPYDRSVGWQWARVMTSPGAPVNASDAWIAACAIRHRLPLVTHNRKNFAHISGLILVTEAK